jgi:hypothetical protein
LKLKIGVPRLVTTSNRILTIISVARAVWMPPRSMMSIQPNQVSSSVTTRLAAGSSPEMNTLWSPWQLT